MTRIPDDHTAARELERRFRKLGAEKAVQGRRSPVGGLRAVIAGVGTLGILAVAGLLIPVLPSEPDPPRQKPFSSSVRPEAGYRVPDPQDGSSWVVQGFADAGGARCVKPDLISTEEFPNSPAFRPDLDVDETASTCLQGASDQVRVVSRTVSTNSGPRSLVYGVVGPQVRSVRLQRDDASERILVSPKGVFLLVRAGPNSFRTAAVVVDSGNRVQRIDL